MINATEIPDEKDQSSVQWNDKVSMTEILGAGAKNVELSKTK